MSKLTLEELQQMCKLNLDKKHVQEVLQTIKTSKCQFHPGIVQPQSPMASLYELRLSIVKEKEASDSDFIDDFERAVSSLQNSHSDRIALTFLYAEGTGFLVFYEPESKTILSVIKAKPGTAVPVEVIEV